MRTAFQHVHWQEKDWWLGYLEDYPDYWTQGETFDDLIEHLRDLHFELHENKFLSK